jgi:hypothetical protein
MRVAPFFRPQRLTERVKAHCSLCVFASSLAPLRETLQAVEEVLAKAQEKTQRRNRATDMGKTEPTRDEVRLTHYARCAPVAVFLNRSA